MEKITSVRRGLNERRVRKAIAPIFGAKKAVRINFEESYEKVYEKIVKYYMALLYKKDEECGTDTLSRIITQLKELGLDCNYRFVHKNTPEYVSLKNCILKYNFSSKTRPATCQYDIFRFEITNHKYGFNFYTTLDTKIKRKFRNGSFFNVSMGKYYVQDVYRLAAEYLILADMQSFIDANRDYVKAIIAEEIVKFGIWECDKNEFEDVLQYCDENQIKWSLRSNPHYGISKEYLKLMSHIFRSGKIYDHVLETHESHNKFNIASQNALFKCIVSIVFKLMAEEDEDLKIEAYSENQMSSEYARSFEIKKNINKEIFSLMQSSLFRSYFKDVEYDNEIDKLLIKKIEEEFIEVAKYLGLNDMDCHYTDRTIRFRKLGKHKASGLYWPYANCVCVDLDGVHSLMHEVIHMLDYTKNEGEYLRESIEFRAIAIKYMQEIDEAFNNLSVGSYERISYYNPGTKYNRKYYKNRAEIFARCGELYLRKCLNLNSNLVSECNKPEYYCSNELLSMINEFYSKYVFTSINEDKREKVISLASQIHIRNESVAYSDIKDSNYVVSLPNGQVKLVL